MDSLTLLLLIITVSCVIYVYIALSQKETFDEHSIYNNTLDVYTDMGEGVCMGPGSGFYNMVQGYSTKQKKSEEECKTECSNDKNCIGFTHSIDNICHIHMTLDNIPDNKTKLDSQFYIKNTITSANKNPKFKCFKKQPPSTLPPKPQYTTEFPVIYIDSSTLPPTTLPPTTLPPTTLPPTTLPPRTLPLEQDNKGQFIQNVKNICKSIYDYTDDHEKPQVNHTIHTMLRENDLKSIEDIKSLLEAKRKQYNSINESDSVNKKNMETSIKVLEQLVKVHNTAIDAHKDSYYDETSKLRNTIQQLESKIQDGNNNELDNYIRKLQSKVNSLESEEIATNNYQSLKDSTNLYRPPTTTASAAKSITSTLRPASNNTNMPTTVMPTVASVTTGAPIETTTKTTTLYPTTTTTTTTRPPTTTTTKLPPTVASVTTGAPIGSTTTTTTTTVKPTKNAKTYSYTDIKKKTKSRGKCSEYRGGNSVVPAYKFSVKIQDECQTECNSNSNCLGYSYYDAIKHCYIHTLTDPNNGTYNFGLGYNPKGKNINYGNNDYFNCYKKNLPENDTTRPPSTTTTTRPPSTTTTTVKPTMIQSDSKCDTEVKQYSKVTGSYDININDSLGNMMYNYIDIKLPRTYGANHGTKEDNVSKCSEVCNGNSECKSFIYNTEWNNNKTNCFLFNSDLSNKKDDSSNNKYTVYAKDKNCCNSNYWRKGTIDFSNSYLNKLINKSITTKDESTDLNPKKLNHGIKVPLDTCKSMCKEKGDDCGFFIYDDTNTKLNDNNCFMFKKYTKLVDDDYKNDEIYSFDNNKTFVSLDIYKKC